MIAATIAGAVLATTLLWVHSSDRMRAIENILAGQIAGRAAGLDMQMQITVGHLQALRQRAEFFYAEFPTPDAVPGTPLLDALMASNPGDDPTRPYMLDRLPSPYLTEQIGNIIALPSHDVALQPGLSRPDLAGWRQEAAMTAQLLPLMAVTQQVVPGAERLIYASVSGMTAIHPWVRSDETDLLLQLATRPAFRQAAPAMNPTEAPVWTLSGNGDAQSLVAALPLSLHGRYFGLFTVEIALKEFQAKLGPVSRTASHIALVDAEGQIITSVSGNKQAPRPQRLADLLPDAETRLESGSSAAVRGLWEPYVIAAPLKLAPWRLVYISSPLDILVPAMRDILLSVAGFLAALLLVLYVARRLMLRTVAVREAATEAERDARAAAERALADLRAAHDELDFLNREKTRFFSLVSHDLRGPFNAMLGMTRELADHAPRMSPEQTADFAASVHEMARKVFDLLENMLQWSRVQMSGTPFTPALFPIRELVGDAIRDVATVADAKAIHILDAVGDRWVLADRTMILAVLRNLLMNAIKFSHPGGTVQITSRAMGDRLELAVTDKGIGMEPQQVEQLMRAGPGASRPGTKGETGTGLGLALVRDLVLRHGGGLHFDSRPGVGTSVSFTLPLSNDPAETQRLLATQLAE